MSRHLLHIGYPKTGSTFLQAWFEAHPELRYVPGGLAGFHDVLEVCSAEQGSFRYHVTSCENLAWPVAPGTNAKIGLAEDGANPAQLAQLKSNQAAVCTTLRDIYPGSLVLIVTRGFRSMVLSSYSQYVRTGGVLTMPQTMKLLADYLEEDESHYFDFDYLIGCYQDAFGADNVIVLPYEMLLDDPGAFLNAIQARLGLTGSNPPIGTLNPSLSAPELIWYPKLTTAARKITAPLGRRLHDWLFDRYLARIGGPRLAVMIRALQRLRPGRSVSAADVPLEVLAYCRGKAANLGSRPEYGPYRSEYLLH